MDIATRSAMSQPSQEMSQPSHAASESVLALVHAFLLQLETDDTCPTFLRSATKKNYGIVLRFRIYDNKHTYATNVASAIQNRWEVVNQCIIA